MAYAGDYSANGVQTVPAYPLAGEAVEIAYSGLLAASGATEVYAHIGYGDAWDGAHDRLMLKTADGFPARLWPPSGARTVNFCFHDPANNWDNNSGHNYSLDLHATGAASAEFAAELGAGFAFAYSPAKSAGPHGVRGRTLTTARQLT